MRALVPILAVLAVLVVGPAFVPGVRADDPPAQTQGHTADEMRGANRAAAMLLSERLKRDRPRDHRLLQSIRRHDLLVVRGAYDHVEWVLRQVGVPFEECQPLDLARRSLRGVEVVLVNCPGQVGSEGARTLRRFVREGGLLFTTDWALLNVLEPAFPGTVRYTRRPTRDDVVSIRVAKPEHLFLTHVLTGNDAHLWWLESSSYPIQVLDRRRVEVLIDSAEMRRKYGSGPIAVTFRSGRGRVVHIVSHFYLQRSELRTGRDRLKAKAFAEDLGFPPASPAARRLEREGLAELDAAELRSAYSAQQFLANLLIEAKRAQGPVPQPEPRPEPPPRPEPDPLPVDATRALAAQDTALRDAPAGSAFRAVARGLRLRVLARRDGWVQVRTPTGATGWLPQDAVAPPR